MQEFVALEGDPERSVMVATHVFLETFSTSPAYYKTVKRGLEDCKIPQPEAEALLLVLAVCLDPESVDDADGYIYCE